MPMSETDPNELVHYSVENKVATITLNRPEKLNAFSDELVVALHTTLRRFEPIPRRSQPSFTELGEPSRPVRTCTSANLGNARSSSVSADRRVMALTPPTSSCTRSTGSQ